jgi:hypothetical protein
LIFSGHEPAGLSESLLARSTRQPLFVLVRSKVADTECRRLVCQTGMFEERRLFEDHIVQCGLDSAAKDESG